MCGFCNGMYVCVLFRMVFDICVWGDLYLCGVFSKSVCIDVYISRVFVECCAVVCCMCMIMYGIVSVCIMLNDCICMVCVYI